MKAVIMAGGEGLRLRPLTESLPKPLARLCGRPVLDYIFDMLEDNGVKECVLALGCHAGEVRAHCEENSRPGMMCKYSVEETPLGTAGGVKLALTGETPPEDGVVLVLSGDALWDFSLKEGLAFHKKSGAAVTILTVQASDPREYGLVISEENGRVTGFVEKPSYAQAVGEYANTGIYFLSPHVLEEVPEGIPWDFAGDLFPGLLKQGQAIYAYAPQGYWCDIGNLEAYRAAQGDLLHGRVKCRQRDLCDRQNEGASRGSRLGGGCILVPPVYIGKGVCLEDGAIIGPDVILDDGCTVGKGARIAKSIVLPRGHVGNHARLEGAILCADGAVKHGAVLGEGSAVGERAVVGAKAEVRPGVRMDAGAWLGDGQIAFDHMDGRGGAARCFDDEGLRGEIGVELTPELAVRVGCALGSLGVKENPPVVGVASANRRACRVLADALAAGIQSTGAGVLHFGGVFEAMFAFGMSCNALKLGVYVGEGSPEAIRVVVEGGLPAPRSLEREMEQRIARSLFTRAGSGGFGDCIDFSGIGVLYLAELLRLAPQGLEGISAGAFSTDPFVKRFVNDLLSRLGCDVEDREGIRLQVSPEGSSLTLTQGGVTINTKQAVAAYGRLLFAQKKDLAVENDFPRAMDRFAAEWGCRVYRYMLCPTDEGDSQGRLLARSQCARDGLQMAVLLLADMRTRGISLGELAGELPPLAVEQRELEFDLRLGNPAKILAALRGRSVGEGILLEEKQGTVLLRPRKSGEALRIFAEAASWETAKELCADIVDRVKHLLDNGVEKRYYE